MGTSEVAFFWFFTIFVVSIILYILTFINLLNFKTRFRLLRSTRREFYECGCRPFIQKPFQLALHFLLICVFFIIYDIELLFSFPLVSSFSNFSWFDFLSFLFLYGTFILSLVFDFNKLLTKWRV